MNKEESIVKVRNGQIPLIVPESMVIFAAHPDDELLSTGGTILKYSELGTKITVIIVTGGYGGYSREEYKKDIAEKRKKEFIEVTKHLHCDFIELGYDELEISRKIISQCTKLIRELRPQVVFIPHPSDDHRTHRFLAQIVKEAIYHTATGKAYGGYGKEFMPDAVYYYESPSCKFQYIDASVFITVDISKYWEEKIKIFNEAYSSQIEVLDRVVTWAERTAKLRGNEAQCEYGECFIPYTEYVPLRILLK